MTLYFRETSPMFVCVLVRNNNCHPNLSQAGDWEQLSMLVCVLARYAACPAMNSWGAVNKQKNYYPDLKRLLRRTLSSGSGGLGVACRDSFFVSLPAQVEAFDPIVSILEAANLTL